MNPDPVPADWPADHEHPPTDEPPPSNTPIFDQLLAEHRGQHHTHPENT